jgi:hypothetical protein
MSEKAAKQQRVEARGGSTTAKGKIVEQVVADLHNSLGVIKLERNVRVPVQGSPSKRKREIDVLLTLNAGGYHIQMAFECKNEKKPVEPLEVGDFIEKLQDLNIPTQLGVFVSASGFTTAALERAAKAGVRPRTLSGLDPDGLASTVLEVYQSTVFLLLEVGTISITPPIDNVARPLPFFIDKDRQFMGSPVDLLWRRWLQGQIPLTIGAHELELPMPQGCSLLYQQIEDAPEIVVAESAITIEVHITGYLVTVHGQAHQHTLINALTNQVDRGQLRAHFDPPPAKVPVVAIRSETALTAATLDAYNASHILLSRVPLPRIRCNAIFWPPSERVGKMLVERVRAFQAGLIPEVHLPPDSGIEGEDLAVIWEPIWDKYPVLLDPHAPW